MSEINLPANRYGLILGGNSGLGQALALRFAQGGYHLLLTAKSIDQFDQRLTKRLISDYRISVSWIVFDGLDYQAHAGFYHSLPHQPEVVIMTIGHQGDQIKAQEDFKEVQRIMGANVMAQMSILNEVAKAMEQDKSGFIIGISSVAGERGRQKNYFYGAAKAAFTTYLSGLRNRLYGAGVQVMTVLPGYIRTPMLADAGVPGWLATTPEHAAQMIYTAFLRKKKVLYITKKWRWIMWIIKTIPESIFCRLNI